MEICGLNNEENKAIEYLKQNSIPILRYDNFGNILSPLYHGTFEKETILNLIEKQSKEIKLLKEENEKYKSPPFFDEDKYTENDKIKAKIEELERDKNKLYKEQGNIEEIKIYSVIDIIKAEILRFKELLEKE